MVSKPLINTKCVNKRHKITQHIVREYSEAMERERKMGLDVNISLY